jgi:hypothetical protein
MLAALMVLVAPQAQAQSTVDIKWFSTFCGGYCASDSLVIQTGDTPSPGGEIGIFVSLTPAEPACVTLGYSFAGPTGPWTTVPSGSSCDSAVDISVKGINQACGSFSNGYVPFSICVGRTSTWPDEIWFRAKVVANDGTPAHEFTHPLYFAVEG